VIEALVEAREALAACAATSTGERKQLADTALRNLDSLAKLPLTPDVLRLTGREMEKIATAPDEMLEPGSAALREFTALAELRRFVAGQLHWEEAGVPKSFLAKMGWRDAIRAIGCVRRAGGWQPWFEMHLPSRGAPFLIPAEYQRSYARMAACMAMQPDICGVLGGSWLHAEETMAISPHLRWLNDLFLSNGGILVHLGPAPENSGFLVGSEKRKELHRAGKYHPRHAVFLWPREALLAWARSQPSS
jgi:hypothetical protein